MNRKVTTVIRDVLPTRHQVPIRFAYRGIRGTLEPELATLPLLVKRGYHVADVGGNRGIYAYPLWRLGAKVEVFEPNPRCAAVLEAWRRNKPDVRVHRVALSTESGSGTLYVPLTEEGQECDATGTLESGLGRAVHAKRVETQALDAYGFTDLAFVKIDVEGHERAVVAGGSQTIRASRPALLVEIEQRFHTVRIETVFELFFELRYEGHFMQGGRWRPIKQFRPEVHQCEGTSRNGSAYVNNFLFLAEERCRSGDYDSVFATQRGGDPFSWLRYWRQA